MEGYGRLEGSRFQLDTVSSGAVVSSLGGGGGCGAGVGCGEAGGSVLG